MIPQPTQASTVNGRATHLSAQIRHELEAAEAIINSQLVTRYASISGLIEHAQGIAGKRLRPILLLLSAKSMGQPTAESIRLAAVVELLHAATLVHDDVLDEAKVRRCRPTVHCLWGTKSSILLGDFLFTKAYELATSGTATHPALTVARCAAEICEGEMRQQAAVGNWTISQAEYLDILRQKTAELCATSCALGAWTLNAQPAAVGAFESFGRYLGIAFQLFDDWLDIWGTEAVGKTLGSDLGQRTPTLPVIRLLSTASPNDRQAIIDLLDSSDAQSLNRLRRRLDDSDASDFTRTSAEQMVRLAIDALELLPRNEATRALEQLAWYSIRREV